MDTWDLALLVVAGYFAVMALVRLMIQRRDELVVQLRVRMEEEKAANSSDQQPPSDPSSP